VREKRSMEVELLRARAQMSAAQTYDPAPSPTIRMENPRMWPEKPRRVFGRRPSYTSTSSKVSSPETPCLASPLSELQSVEQPPTYAQLSPTDPALSSDEKGIEVHPDFMGICTDGTAAWATQRKVRESGTSIIGFNGVEEEAQEAAMLPSTTYTGPLGHENEGQKPRPSSRPSSFRAKRPKINLVIPENQHKKAMPAVIRDSPSTDILRESPSIDSIATVNPRASIIAKAVRGLTASPAMSHSSESDGLISEASVSTESLISKKPPKSLRPFSRSAPKYYASLQSSVEDVSNVPALCSSSVASLEDAPEEGVKSCYSRQSLYSEAVTEPGTKVENGRPLSGTGSDAFSIVTPGQAGVYDEPVPSIPNIPSHIKEKYGIGDLSNKPLPPEPGDLHPAPLKLQTAFSNKIETSSLKTSGQSPSRLISRFAFAQLPRPESPASSLASRNQPPRQFESPFKGNIHNLPSLKGKHSANDLDALDRAFQKAMPSKGKHLTLEEAEIALEFHLATIAEWEECRPDSPIINSPVRLGGVPFYIPGKKRPAGSIKTVQPPARITGKRSSGYSAHVANQIKSPARSRASWASSYAGSYRHSLAPDGKQMKWSLKAQKVLGRLVSSEIPPSLEPSYQSQSQSLPGSPDHMNEDSDNEGQSPDPAILEIHKRLELLQMSQNADAARMHDEQFERFHRLDKATDPAPTNYAELYPPPPIPEDTPPTTQCSSIRPKSTATIRSLASLAVSDIPELYANMPPSQETYAQLQAEAADRQISPSAAEAVLLHIMKSVENLQDLFACAVVSKGFYRTFKRHELDLMKIALRKMSPAAWELREAVIPSGESTPVSTQPKLEYTPGTFLRCYTRDLYIMVALKSLMVARCSSFLRSQTIAALSGNNKERSFDLDNAFWRVWTFCKIFGCDRRREGDLLAQIDWLKGGNMTRETSKAATSGLRIYEASSAMVGACKAFGKGNCCGLEEWELWDMVEIWVCLGVLIHGFLKDNKRGMARDYGVFDHTDIPEGDATAEDMHIGRLPSTFITIPS
jgi:hypothetical protein